MDLILIWLLFASADTLPFPVWLECASVILRNRPLNGFHTSPHPQKYSIYVFKHLKSSGMAFPAGLYVCEQVTAQVFCIAAKAGGEVAE